MKLRVLDQIAVTALSAETLRPGQVVDNVSDALGKELLTKHPNAFRRLDKPVAAKPAPKPKAKPAAAPKNKVEPASTAAKA